MFCSLLSSFGILLIWPDVSCHALSFTGLRPSGMYALACMPPALWLDYCILSQIQRLTQARRFPGPLAYTRTPNYSTPMLLFSSHHHHYVQCDSRNILIYRPFLPPGLIAPFGFRFVRGFRSTRSLYSRLAFASAAMALSSRQSSHNILITGSHMLLRDVSLISFTRNHAISCVDRYYLSQASLLVLFVLRSLSKIGALRSCFHQIHL